MRHAPCPLRHRRTSPSHARRQARCQTAVVVPSVPTGGPVRGGWVRREHPPACGAVVAVPGPSSGVVGGVVRSPALAPPCSPGGSGASPGPGGSARRGRVAPRAAPWPAQRLLPCVGGGVAGSGGGGRGRRQRQAHHGGSALPGRRVGHGGVTRSPSGCQVPCPRPSPTVSRVEWPPAAQGVPTGVAAVGHREGRVPASVPSNPTRACRRPPTAAAPASLRLLAAPEAWR